MKEKKDLDFAKDRDKYCLTSEEGQEYIQSNKAVEEMNEIWEKQEKRSKILKGSKQKRYFKDKKGTFIL